MWRHSSSAISHRLASQATLQIAWRLESWHANDWY